MTFKKDFLERLAGSTALNSYHALMNSVDTFMERNRKKIEVVSVSHSLGTEIFSVVLIYKINMPFIPENVW
jgi:hypothetical protein